MVAVSVPRPMARAERYRQLPRRAMRLVDRLVFPAASGPAEHWQRLVMYAAVDRHLESLGPGQCMAAEISGDAHSGRPWKAYTSLSYPDFDLCAPIAKPCAFDVVICEQVLEHVVDPCAAAANLRELCTPGGHVIVSTPFLIKVHELALGAILDYWRFTPRGLRLLLERAGLEVDEIGTWGNRQCVMGNFNRWSARRRWHSMRNEPDFPVQVWAFARRPG
jgi:SAM-dependent methyltransferase